MGEGAESEIKHEQMKLTMLQMSKITILKRLGTISNWKPLS